MISINNNPYYCVFCLEPMITYIEQTVTVEREPSYDFACPSLTHTPWLTSHHGWIQINNTKFIAPRFKFDPWLEKKKTVAKKTTDSI